MVENPRQGVEKPLGMAWYRHGRVEKPPATPLYLGAAFMMTHYI